MTSIVSNILSFLPPFFFFFSFSFLRPCLVPRIISIAYPSARFCWLGPSFHHLECKCKCRRRCKAKARQDKANLASFFLPSSFFAGYLHATGWFPSSGGHGMGGCTALFYPPPPLSPGAPSRVWNVQVKTKVPDRYQTSRGVNNFQNPHPGDPTIPKLDRSRLDSL